MSNSQSVIAEAIHHSVYRLTDGHLSVCEALAQDILDALAAADFLVIRDPVHALRPSACSCDDDEACDKCRPFRRAGGI